MRTKTYTITPYHGPNTNPPVDWSDPKAAKTAVHICFPHELCDEAWRTLNFLNDTTSLFIYKGMLVMTDEANELTPYQFGGPIARWTIEKDYDSWEAIQDAFFWLDDWLRIAFHNLEETMKHWMEDDPESCPIDLNAPVERWEYTAE